MSLIEKLAQDMTAAMKGREEARLSALRMMKAALMKQKVDSPKPLDEAAEAFRKAGREAQAQKEEAERTLIESYLPAAAGEADMDAAVAAALAENPGAAMKQMGAIMKAAQARLAGKTVDGKTLSDKVRAKLVG